MQRKTEQSRAKQRKTKVNFISPFLPGSNIDSIDIDVVLGEVPPLINESDLHISQVPYFY
jgi:hypothetical protein